MSDSERIGMDKKEVRGMRALFIAESERRISDMQTLIHDPVALKKAFDEFLEFDKTRQQFEDRLVQKYSVNVLENLEGGPYPKVSYPSVDSPNWSSRSSNWVTRVRSQNLGELRRGKPWVLLE